MLAFRAYSWFLSRRLGLTLLTLWGLASLVFLMIKLMPGDEAQMAAGADASAAQIEAVRERLGLDAPVIMQYFSFLGRLLRGDLGTSIVTLQPVLSDLEKVLPSTLELVVIAMLLNLAVAIPVGIIAAYRQGGMFDNVSRITAVMLGGMPAFWLALVLQYVLGSVWRVVPISGQQGYGMASPVVTGAPTLDALLAGNIAGFFDTLHHIILPAAVLAALFAAQIFRTLRASLLGVLRSDFIMAVRAKGATARHMLVRHALPNSLNPVLTLSGTQAGAMIGSAVLVETVFARQGIGAYMFNAVAQKDTPSPCSGSVMFIGTAVCLVNLIVDILQLLVDPRIRAAQLGEPKPMTRSSPAHRSAGNTAARTASPPSRSSVLSHSSSLLLATAMLRPAVSHPASVYKSDIANSLMPPSADQLVRHRRPGPRRLLAPRSSALSTTLLSAFLVVTLYSLIGVTIATDCRRRSTLARRRR
jgi:dipeptide transport system permease protein